MIDPTSVQTTISNETLTAVMVLNIVGILSFFIQKIIEIFFSKAQKREDEEIQALKLLTEKVNNIDLTMAGMKIKVDLVMGKLFKYNPEHEKK